ncbi:axonemal p66.0 [Trypanosoma rangeli]|uniref:Axonemal p66.0 n=1 Tax=Trypanosoma rangeli TaxID=5698 RepID=A0A3R7MAS7_TRYRA|nr:axonemal p66.0 [Trypanosoma rangeli]RNE99260.1 axonemal p66.0 [Trypanosoma rangeli]|eukprot:RNE99260.1 axonemal p66.0 [Trypanosoma rangeli]
MAEAEGTGPTASPTLKRAELAVLVPRGTGATAMESLRRRYVQAELQLRETEDRFRRDCARQEQELELLRIENNKYKAKIEEMRMTETMPQEMIHHTLVSGAESKLLKASSRRYCMAREAVERSRDELNEIRARVASTRQRIYDTNRKMAGTHTRGSLPSKPPYNNCAETVLQTQASRSQLRGLEAHVELETDRRADFIEEVKNLRKEIDVLLTLQRRTRDVFRDREREMLEVVKESSFLIEVCNVLFEERDACQQQLVELQQAFEADNEAYEKTFQDIVGVEERDKTVKGKLRENIAKLEKEMRQVVTEREAVERVLDADDTALRKSTMGTTGHENDSDIDSTGVSLQLAEFERYIGRLAEIAGSESLPDIERYICEGGEQRLKLYSLLHRTQDAVAALTQEKETLQQARLLATDGPMAGQSAREEMESLQSQLVQIQRDTLDHEQQAEFVRSQLDAVLSEVQSIFNALGCDDRFIIDRHGVSVLSRGTVNLFLAAIEQRLEEYVAVWMRQHQPLQTLPPAVGFDAVGPKLTALVSTSTLMAATPPHMLPSTHEPDTVGHDKNLTPDLNRGEATPDIRLPI